MVGSCCGGCTYKAGPGEIPVEGHVQISTSRSSPTGWAYDLIGGGGPSDIPFQQQCPNPGSAPPTIATSFGWSRTDLPYQGPHLVGQYEGVIDQDHGVVRWDLTGKEDPDKLKANPGGPYEVTRAESVALDGSHSTGKIASYRWSFAPAGDCSGATLKPSNKTGSGTSVVPLCSLSVTLTVKDRQGKSASGSTSIRVTPRTDGFRMPDVEHTPVDAPLTDQRINDPPFLHEGSDYGLLMGKNVAACVPGSEGPPMLCPPTHAAGGRQTGLGTRYQLAQVHDSGGPFDGFFYVASTALTVKRIGLVNSYFLPNGPKFLPGQKSFWAYNESHVVKLGPNRFGPPDLSGFLQAVRAHEGMGATGRLGTGHSGRMQRWIRDAAGEDPREEIEDEFGRAKPALQEHVDSEITTAGVAVHTAARDPLPVIWSGNLWIYDREDSRWRQVHLSIGGPDYVEFR
jgi:hypothetical protein